MLDGRYELLEVIGRGGMAVVYKARDQLLNRFVAVKILRDDMAADAEFRENFKKEAQAIAMLSHANIVAVYDVSRTPELDYIVMELLEGITLKQYMQSKGALSCKESVHFATQIARALSHAHSKGIIHRDIKPQNVMIGLDGNVKVADFGIAYLENALSEGTNTAVGSVHYISPEQAKGLPADARSDIYSLGIVMYEMLTGTLPFTDASAEEIARQQISAEPVPPDVLNPEIPPELVNIVCRAMTKDIEKRYQSADEFLRDLDEYRLSTTEPLPHLTAEGDPAAGIVIPPDVPPVSRSGELSKESYARRHRRANKISLLFGILLVLLFAAAVFLFLWNYWLKDLFSEPVKITIPNFVGTHYEELMDNREFQDIYNFTVESVADPDVESGIILRQNPAEGTRRTLDSDGVDVTLIVSAGIQMIEIPDVVNHEYREAIITLQKAGFAVSTPLDYETNENVTVDYVISTDPAAGDKLPAGSTIYVTVSAGPKTETVQMPNLIGLGRSRAIALLEGLNLSVGTITPNPSDLPVGTIFWQSVKAGDMVNKHERVYLQVSSGPAETEPPEPSPEPTPAPTETPAQTEPPAPTAPPAQTEAPVQTPAPTPPAAAPQQQAGA
jgi:serine/threonine-protein kinase